MKLAKRKYIYIEIISIAVMLVVWKLLSMHFHSNFILPSPEDTIVSTVKLICTAEFLKIVGTTILRGLIGFIIAAILGIGIGILAGIYSGLAAFMKPIVVTFRATPVVAIILLALIWLTPDSVPVFIAFLTMFPLIYINVTDGFNSVDSSLIEMAKFYGAGKRRITSEVYIPSIMPFIISGISSAVGIGWRAIIVGEVLAQPKYGIGTMMQGAQTFLNVDILIAWTLIAVLISSLFELLIRWEEKKLITWK
jgi:NitT/TauT family transport system permease protein